VCGMTTFITFLFNRSVWRERKRKGGGGDRNRKGGGRRGGGGGKEKRADVAEGDLQL